jgi:hypothetical protein
MSKVHLADFRMPIVRGRQGQASMTIALTHRGKIGTINGSHGDWLP